MNGAPVTLNGRLHPFGQTREATLELKVGDVDLTRIDEYSPVPIGSRFHSGYLDSNLTLTFIQADGETPKIVLTGEAAVRGSRLITAPLKSRIPRKSREPTSDRSNSI